jgi:DDE superfamily endonuclease
MNLQVIASPHGDILWVSGALPGSVHDKKAEWIWGALDELEKQGLVTLADKGYQGSKWAKVPYKGRTSPSHRKRPTGPTRNSAPRANGKRPAQDLEHP